jgi:hypothetical protein
MSDTRNTRRRSEEYPLYCDYSCPHSAFSDPCAVGACRRDVGVWCGKARRLHSKHARCLFRPADPAER